MKCKVELRPTARRQLAALGKRDRKRIAIAIDWLQQAGDKAHAALDCLGRESDVSTLKTRRKGGRTYYIISLDELRLACTIEKDALIICVIAKNA